MNLLASLLLFIHLIGSPWGTDLEVAKKTATQEHKLILLNFSGSDWCGPCILLRKEYLDSPAFLSMAESKLVLVNADFPRKQKNKLTPEQVKKNEILAEAYNPDGNFPFTLLLDAEGKVIHAWRGVPDKPVDSWVSEITTFCTSN